jgi:OmpA-OmpF porin, OOP family
MNNYLIRLSSILLCAMTSVASATDSTPKDPSSPHDHPIISRFAGSSITGYQTIDFDAMTLPLAPFKDSAFGKTESIKGRITRIAYAAPPGKSVLEISTNFEQALERAGFQKRYSCYGTPEDPACGDDYGVSNALLPARIVRGLTSNPNVTGDLLGTIRVIQGALFVETARLDRADGPVDVVLFVAKNEDKVAGIYLQICEGKAMTNGQVTADAKGSEKDMAQGLAQQGHISLYGIHFGTDSAVIIDDSSSTLGEMASLMKSKPELKVYIVGHTDNAGALDHNLALSNQRAQAVVKALQDMGVAPGRMTAKGLASLAPVATNTTDDGKAKNRRVELVAQ